MSTPPPWTVGGWRPTNTKAILSVALLSIPPAAIILGVLARNEIKTTGEAGWGLATTGMIAGIVIVSSYVLFALAYVAFLVIVFGGVLFRGATFVP